MVMRTYLKTLGRMFRHHLARFLSLFFIVLISVGFISGFGRASDRIDDSLCNYYADRSVSDFIVKSTSSQGFTEEEIDAVKALFPGALAETGMSFDLQVSEKRSVRLQFVDPDGAVNRPEIVEGEEAEAPTDIYAERSDKSVVSYAPGTQLELDFKAIIESLGRQNGSEIDDATSALLDNLEPVAVTVRGVVQSPLTFAGSGEPSYNNPADAELPDTESGVGDMDLLENILYIPVDLIPTYRDIVPSLPEEADAPLIGTGDIYISLADKSVFDAFSSEYEGLIQEGKAAIAEILPDAEVITLYENYSFKSLTAYSDKLMGISYIVMAAFLLVTALVAFSTMTRLLDEERAQIACLETLGYSSFRILSKYMLFALAATLAGGFAAQFVGGGISVLVYQAFGTAFEMPPISGFSNPSFYFIALAVIVLGTLLVTVASGLKMTRDAPANLLRPKAPRAGRKVFLEKIPALWKRIPFRYKSTFRNVFRYVNRFVMSVVSVAFSAGLVLAGLALLDLCLFRGLASPAIVGISALIIVFAGLLTAVVIYTLTNISISERRREIATLMVLGYNDREVTGYIYRELYINSIIGIVFGYPVGVGLIALVYTAIGTGTLSGVSWFIWLIAPAIVLLFTFLVTLLLSRKILSVDMNDSLKAVE